MGIVTMGIPKQIVIELAQINGSTIFVETGTYRGNTTRWASNHFETVHTIERAESLFHNHCKGLATIKGVVPHLGDSRNILPQIVKSIQGQKAVYWLDGHWSGGETAGENDECPLMDELACLQNRTEDIILIDDARLFLCAPNHFHNASQWPTIAEIVSVFSTSNNKPFIQVLDDVIFIVPNEYTLKNHLVDYAQKRSDSFWNEFARLQRRHLSPWEQLKAYFR